MFRNEKIDCFRHSTPGPIDEEVKILYRTMNGTALPGVDFLEVRSNIIFRSGETEKTLDVEVLDDASPEFTEHFYIQLGKTFLTMFKGFLNEDFKGISRFFLTNGPGTFLRPSTFSERIKFYINILLFHFGAKMIPISLHSNAWKIIFYHVDLIFLTDLNL